MVYNSNIQARLDGPYKDPLDNWLSFEPTTSSEPSQTVFGWASVALAPDGTPVVDAVGDVICPFALEAAAYNLMLCGGYVNVEHQGPVVGRIIEACFISPEKVAAMGLTGPVPTGLWCGAYIYDKDIYDKIADGTLSMFSIGGWSTAQATEGGINEG